MPSYPCNLGTLRWSGPFGGSFRPEGKLTHVGTRPVAGLGRTAWTSSDTLAARIIVGFNVGSRPVYQMKDLIKLVKRVREEQHADPSATFIAQQGIYQHKDPAQGTVIEDGGQVVIIDLDGLGEGAFEGQMIEVAEVIAREFEQETVIVEIQKNGITQRVHGVTA